MLRPCTGDAVKFAIIMSVVYDPTGWWPREVAKSLEIDFLSLREPLDRARDAEMRISAITSILDLS
jgi:hypothetical protein